MKKVILYVLMLFMAGAALSACGNTLNGVGKDMENAGQRIQETF